MLSQIQNQKLQSLINQLEAKGYAPFQISHIIKDVTGTINVIDLNEEKYNQLVANLEEYIKFAEKCFAR